MGPQSGGVEEVLDFDDTSAADAAADGSIATDGAAGRAGGRNLSVHETPHDLALAHNLARAEASEHNGHRELRNDLQRACTAVILAAESQPQIFSEGRFPDDVLVDHG